MNTDSKKLTALQKALDLNLDNHTYGTIAEVGAGQEVARNFFQSGGASGTVAKTISAYDMQVSDAIYGKDVTGRYVTRTRLTSMLDKEFDLLVKRVADIRPPETQFFTFADTVAAKAYKSEKLCQGWMGMKLQTEPKAEPSNIILHVSLLDSTNLGQQSALGILGVNLIYAAFHFKDNPDMLIDSLFDNLTWGRIELDYIEFSGPGFEGIDNRKMMLRLVQSSLTPIVMFGQDGNGILPQDVLHNKDLLILRGLFRPFTNIHRDMINYGLEGFSAEQKRPLEEIAFFCEMNIAKFVATGEDDITDLLTRVEMLTQQGYNVMISSHFRYFRISEYFARDKSRKIGFVLSVENIYQIFDESYYEGFKGGILAAMGALFANNTKLFVYPNLLEDGTLTTVANIKIKEELRYLFLHISKNRGILPIHCSPDIIVPVDDMTLLQQMSKGDESWKKSVPEEIEKRIIEEKLFGFNTGKSGNSIPNT
jgi:hypothetical protein